MHNKNIYFIYIGLMAGSLANTKNDYLSKIKSWICVFLPLVQRMKNEEKFQYLLWGSVWLAFLIALFLNFHQFYLLARHLLARDGFSSCHQQPPVAATQTPDPLTKQMIPCMGLMVSESQPQINCNWPQINCNSFHHRSHFSRHAMCIAYGCVEVASTVTSKV